MFAQIDAQRALRWAVQTNDVRGGESHNSLQCQSSRRSNDTSVVSVGLAELLRLQGECWNAERGFILSATEAKEASRRMSTMSEPAQSRMTTATISVRWASELQQTAGEKALREVLQAWREFYSEKHRGNVIKIDIGVSRP
jgi:hypothetical protein